MIKRLLTLTILSMVHVFGGSIEAHYFYDQDDVRYELYQTNGEKNCNWLFFPGGPGGDSSYLRGLVDQLSLPGNVWLIDLPGNGSHVKEDVDFDQWLVMFPELVKKFENPIIVGHSFGGILPLLFEELEEHVTGLVLFSSTPCLWMEEAVEYAKGFDLPDITDAMQLFVTTPSQETFKKALAACTPYYFPISTLDLGRKLLADLPFEYLPAVWWQRKAVEIEYSAKWIPQNVPTLIIGGKYDCICPYTLFQKDQRFQRQNIKHVVIEDAGHMSWLENPQAVKDAFDEMIAKL